MRHHVCALLLAALLPSAFSDEITSVTTPQERGHVVVHKRLQEAVLVQHQPFTVVYDVMNIGTDVAYNVVVTDVFPERSFEVRSGSATLSLERMEPGANFTSRLVLVPKVAGVMTVGRAEVKYKWLPRDELGLEEEDEEGAASKAAASFEESAEQQLSQSSSQGKVDILSPEAFARQSKSKHATAMACALAAVVAVLAPYYLAGSASHAKSQ